MITYSRLGAHGRLGNQLWQVASTAGIAQTLGQSAGFLKWDYRPYFRLPDEFFPPDIIGREITQAYDTPLVNHMDPRCREYLQDLGLWGAIAPQVWSWFQPSELAMDRIREQTWFADLPRPILSVHVRRGDNAKAPNNYHPLRPWSYYEQSIEQMRGKFESILVTSDDVEWCRTAFSRYEVEHIVAFSVATPRKKEHEIGYGQDPFDDWLDLQIMSFCDLHILSNSTFSWWGAFLSHDPAPIYPWPFFGAGLDYIDCGLMFPDSWQRMDHGQQYV